MGVSPGVYRPLLNLKRVATALVFVIYAVVSLEAPRRLPCRWREGFELETVSETFGALYREGLIAPVRGEDGEIRPEARADRLGGDR